MLLIYVALHTISRSESGLGDSYVQYNTWVESTTRRIFVKPFTEEKWRYINHSG